MKRTRNRLLSIGSISTDTTNPMAVVDSLLWDIEHIRLSAKDRATVRRLRKEFDDLGCAGHESEQDAASEILEELTDLAGCYCPDYTYVGSHIGDGADFGVWPDHDATDDGFCFKGERADAGKEYTHCLEVNDHGNCSMFRRAGHRWILTWDCV